MVHGTWVWCDMGLLHSGRPTHVAGVGSISAGLPLICMVYIYGEVWGGGGGGPPPPFMYFFFLIF